MSVSIFTKELTQKIGDNLVLVFQTPMAIVDHSAHGLYQSTDWRYEAWGKAPNLAKRLLKAAATRSFGMQRFDQNQHLAIVPMLNKGETVGYLIADLANQAETEQEAIVQALFRALADISIYMPNPEAELVSFQPEKLKILLQKGLLSHEEALRKAIDRVVDLCRVDTAVLAYLDEQQANFTYGYTRSSEDSLQPCLKDCGLSWWALQTKEPVIVSNPSHDARCSGQNVNCATLKLFICWPLFVGENSFGVLKLRFFQVADLEDWQLDIISQLAVFMSYVIHDSFVAVERADRIRKNSAINELISVAKSSIDLEKLFRLTERLIKNNICPVKQVVISLRADGHLQSNENQCQSDTILNTDRLEFPITLQGHRVGALSLVGINGSLSIDDQEFLGTIIQLLSMAIQGRKPSGTGAEETVMALCWALQVYNQELASHAKLMKDWVGGFARWLSIPEDELQTIQWAGQLQDIGKIKSFHSESPSHVLIGEKILSDYPSLESVAKLVHCHHELYDGTGYPEGLSGSAIPLGARIMLIINDFIMAGQGFAFPDDHWKALTHISLQSGKSYDPNLLTALRNFLHELYGKEEANYLLEKQQKVKEKGKLKHLGLTPRELEILTCLGKGMNNREMAQLLFLSEKTVKTHVTRVLKKLEVSDRTKAAVYAVQISQVK